MTPIQTLQNDQDSADLRQQVLVLYLANSSLSSEVVAWSFFDGASDEQIAAGESPEPPFSTGLDAMRAGWRLLSMSPLLPPQLGAEYSTSVQQFEFLFQRLVPVPSGPA
jgi:hypothetical protein